MCGLFLIIAIPYITYLPPLTHLILPSALSTPSTPCNPSKVLNIKPALAVSGAWKGSNTSKLYEELGWESLTDRGWYRRLLQFYKIINDLAPSYLKDIIPPLRRSLYFVVIPLLSSIVFFPDSIKSWNNIGREFTSLSPISKFKEALLSVIRPAKKSVFAIHSPTGIKKLFQLRVGLTQLKSHRKNHNFLDTPSDLCICQL